MLAPLLALRQACCHPSIGAHGLKVAGRAGTGVAALTAQPPLTMAAVLEQLITDSRVAAEEAQRVLLAALAGGAGVAALRGDAASAARLYRAALAAADANSAAAAVCADPLQRLHLVVNLGRLVGAGVVPCSVDDGDLATAASTIRGAYLADAAATLADREAELDAALEGVRRAGVEEGGVAPAPRGGRRRRAPAAAASPLAFDADAEHGDGWYLAALDTLASSSPDGGQAIVDHVRDELSAGDRYRAPASQNATSLARRLGGGLLSLKPLLAADLDRLAATRATCLTQLADLRARTAALDPTLVAAAGSCGRCRAELGAAGTTCPHCALDDAFVAWEVSLFALTTRAIAGGGRGGRGARAVSAEDAVRAAQAAALSRVGRGGLGEDGGGGALASRRADGVAGTDIIHTSSEAERTLRLLKGELSKKARSDPGAAALASLGDAAIARLAAWRDAIMKARAAALAQRAMLYAADELDMAESTLALAGTSAAVAARGARAAFSLTEAELPSRALELDAEALGAHSDLQAALGRVRYLTSLRGGRDRDATAPRPAGAANPTAVPPSMCPVCHDDLDSELALMPCGHALCRPCAGALVSRAKRASSRFVLCPTCRGRTELRSVANVVATGEEDGEAAEAAAAVAASSRSLPSAPTSPLPPTLAATTVSVDVDGDFGAKMEAVVRRVKALLAAAPSTKIVVFSTWAEVLAIVDSALAANGVRALRPRTRRDVGAAATAFRGDSAPHVLLLRVAHGGAGLTLVEATHVALVEPLLDPAAEAQAVGRVDRIGQTAQTTVHRFTVQGTVETAVAARAAARRDAAVGNGRTRGRASHETLTVGDVGALLGLGGGG